MKYISNFLCSYIKCNIIPIKYHLSIDYCQILKKCRFLICIEKKSCVSPSISMVKKWFTEFRCDRTSTNHSERSGQPIEVSTPEKITIWCWSTRELKCIRLLMPYAFHMVRFHMFSILNDQLGVPRLLSIDHKYMTTSKDCLTAIWLNYFGVL